MIVGLLFWALASSCCGYAVVAGGRDGRRAVALILCATLLSIPAQRFGHHWGRTELLLLSVDLGLLAGLYALMLRSERYWPIWMVGFHLIAVTTHISTVIAPDVTPRLYRAMESVWAIPVLVSMFAGIVMDRRAGLEARLRTAAITGDGRARP